MSLMPGSRNSGGGIAQFKVEGPGFLQLFLHEPYSNLLERGYIGGDIGEKRRAF